MWLWRKPFWSWIRYNFENYFFFNNINLNITFIYRSTWNNLSWNSNTENSYCTIIILNKIQVNWKACKFTLDFALFCLFFQLLGLLSSPLIKPVTPISIPLNWNVEEYPLGSLPCGHISPIKPSHNTFLTIKKGIATVCCSYWRFHRHCMTYFEYIS